MNIYVYGSSLPTMEMPKDRKVQRAFFLYFHSITTVFALIRAVAETMPLESAVELCEQWTKTITLFFDSRADAQKFHEEYGSLSNAPFECQDCLALLEPTDFLYKKVSFAFTPTTIDEMEFVMRVANRLTDK